MSQENTFEHVKGLLGNFAPNYFTLEFDNDNLLIHQVNVKFIKNERLKTFTIPFADILAMDIITEKEIGNKSVIGRGIAGALLFGPAGAIIAGMSGIGGKEKIASYFAISYLTEMDNEPKTIIFNPEILGIGLRNIAFVKKLKSKYENILPSIIRQKYIDNMLMNT